MTANRVWVTSAGRKIPVHLMTNSHLSNALRMVERKLTKGGLNKAGHKELNRRLDMLEKEKARRAKVAESEKALPPESQEIRVDFLQTIGPVIPLCWIPTDDIAAVVNLLKLYRPDDSMKLAQAQFDATINTLNTYVGEAIARNNQPGVMTYTYGDKEKR
jgi:hypothetical protein